jgi:hypothetical protein
MININYDCFTSRQALIAYICLHQETLIALSKKTLHNQHDFIINTKKKVVCAIEPSETSAHKHLFSLLLKKDWTTGELIRLIGYFSAINLLNDISSNPIQAKPLKTLCIYAWEALYKDIIQKEITITKPFVISGIDQIVDFSAPLECIKRLPQQTYLEVWGDKNTQFNHQGIFYHSATHFEHEASHYLLGKTNAVINKEKYQITLEPQGVHTARHFWLLD